MEVLFVCTGNTCRSPLAEVLLRKALATLKVRGISVASAGIAAAPGSPASQGSISVLDSHELAKHSSRQIEESILAQADLVLTMTTAHKETLNRLFPKYSDKIYTLGKYAWGEDRDIADPYGGGREEYLVAKAEIQGAVEKVAQLLHIKTREEKEKMKIALASDHGGFRLKEELKAVVTELGHQFVDYGCPTEDSVDYPDLASAAARAIASGECNLGIIVCGTGLGMSIAANKVKGIRAVTCHDCFSAKMARAHNNANILTLGQRVVGSELAKMIVELFLSTPFEGERHQRRLDKITALEEEFCR